MAESHSAMPDDFIITAPEVNLLVNIVKAEITEQGGVRITGNCIVVLLPHDLINLAKDAILCPYRAATGLKSLFMFARQRMAQNIL